MTPRRGEIWLFDLGMAAKIRPVLIVNASFDDSDRALVTVVAHSTNLRGSIHEIAVSSPVLKPGAFVVQGVTTYPTVGRVKRFV